MNLPRIFPSLRYLKDRQIWQQIVLRLKPYRIGAPVKHDRRNRIRNWVLPVEKRQTTVGTREFRILTQDISVAQWERWNDKDRDKLLLYHLHYLDDLNAVSAEHRTQRHRNIIEQWIDDIPALIGNGGEPFPLSLRIAN